MIVSSTSQITEHDAADLHEVADVLAVWQYLREVLGAQYVA